MFYFPTRFNIDVSISLRGTVMKLKNEGSIHMATMLFYIKQKYYINENCIFFQAALSSVILWSKCQWH